jgi:hypothetical protein
MSTPDLLNAALWYAELGYPVLPCAPGRKMPLTEHGLLQATTDSDQIRTWWTQTPGANVAIRTDSLLVVDVDGLNNPWPGEAQQSASLESAPVSYTPGGGRQHVFRQPPNKSWRNTAGRLAPQVDTRADGGYILVAPSVVKGKTYRWADGHELTCSPDRLPVPPGWLTAALDNLTGSSFPVPTDGNEIPAGQRNGTLARLAGAMRRVGMGGPEILAALERANADRCRPPLSAREVERIATSIARYEPNTVSVALAENHFGQDFGDSKGLPTIWELVQAHPRLRDPVVHGLLRAGETMNIIAPPKSKKSWLVNALALQIAAGGQWLNTFPCEQGDVLILDNELHAETSAQRIPKVGDALGLHIREYGQKIFVQNLRGQLRDVLSLGDFFKSLEPGRFKVIILDAFYRFMPAQMDENDNGTMASIYNVLDRYAATLGCCFVLIHHSTKGNQSGKSVTDVGAGAGSQSRAADAHLVLRAHEEPDVVVLEAAVRSWAPVDPMCLRWQFPIWTPAPDLDPGQLRSERPKRQTSQEPQVPPEQEAREFVERFVSAEPKSRTAILENAMHAGLSGRQCQRLLRIAEEHGFVFWWGGGRFRPSMFSTVPKPDRSEGADERV